MYNKLLKYTIIMNFWAQIGQHDKDQSFSKNKFPVCQIRQLWTGLIKKNLPTVRLQMITYINGVFSPRSFAQNCLT